MAEKRRQHYLPQFYLKGFSPHFRSNNATDDELDQVWCYQIKKRRLSLKSVKNIAWRSYYYSFVDKTGQQNPLVENMYAEIEDTVSRTLKKVARVVDELSRGVETTGLSSEDRSVLVEFVYLNMTRVPAVFDYITRETEAYVRKLETKYGDSVSPEHIKNLTLRCLLQVGRRKDADIGACLIRRDCRILYVPRMKAQFITTDNPIVRLNKEAPNGIAYPSTQIYLPLNRRTIMLLHLEEGRYQIGLYRDVSEVFKLNCFMAKLAKEIVVACNRDYLQRVVETAGI